MPYRIPHNYEWLSSEFVAGLNGEDRFIDLAIYGMKQPGEQNVYRDIEEALLRINGIKTLISHNYYEEERFWRVWNRPNYQAVKKITDPDNIFRDFYVKTCRAAREGIADGAPGRVTSRVSAQARSAQGRGQALTAWARAPRRRTACRSHVVPAPHVDPNPERAALLRRIVDLQHVRVVERGRPGSPPGRRATFADLQISDLAAREHAERIREEAIDALRIQQIHVEVHDRPEAVHAGRGGRRPRRASRPRRDRVTLSLAKGDISSAEITWKFCPTSFGSSVIARLARQAPMKLALEPKSGSTDATSTRFDGGATATGAEPITAVASGICAGGATAGFGCASGNEFASCAEPPAPPCPWTEGRCDASGAGSAALAAELRVGPKVPRRPTQPM